MPRKWQINLSLAWLKGCDIVVAKVRFNLYQSLTNINKRKGWPKIGISLFILHRRINLSKMIRSLTNILCKNSVLNLMAIILLLQILTSIAATVPFVIYNSFLSGYDLNFLPHLQSPDFSSQSDAIQVNNLFGIVFEISFSS